MSTFVINVFPLHLVILCALVKLYEKLYDNFNLTSARILNFYENKILWNEMVILPALYR